MWDMNCNRNFSLSDVRNIGIFDFCYNKNIGCVTRTSPTKSLIRSKFQYLTIQTNFKNIDHNRCQEYLCCRIIISKSLEKKKLSKSNQVIDFFFIQINLLIFHNSYKFFQFYLKFQWWKYCSKFFRNFLRIGQNIFDFD